MLDAAQSLQVHTRFIVMVGAPGRVANTYLPHWLPMTIASLAG
jgi:hypothetical protein